MRANVFLQGLLRVPGIGPGLVTWFSRSLRIGDSLRISDGQDRRGRLTKIFRSWPHVPWKWVGIGHCWFLENSIGRFGVHL